MRQCSAIPSPGRVVCTGRAGHGSRWADARPCALVSISLEWLLSPMRTGVLLAITVSGAVCWGFAFFSGLASIRPYLAWRRALRRRDERLPPLTMLTSGQLREHGGHAKRFLGRAPDPDHGVEKDRDLARRRFLRAMRGLLAFLGLVVLAVVVGRVW